MYKDMSDIDGDNSAEEEEDSNEADEEKDVQLDDAKWCDTISSNNEEGNDQAEASKNEPIKCVSKPSCVDQMHKDWFSLDLCLLCSVVLLPTQMIDWRALTSLMGQPILIEEGQQKENEKLVRNQMMDHMKIQTQEDVQPRKFSQVRLCDKWIKSHCPCSTWEVAL